MSKSIRRWGWKRFHHDSLNYRLYKLVSLLRKICLCLVNECLEVYCITLWILGIRNSESESLKIYESFRLHFGIELFRVTKSNQTCQSGSWPISWWLKITIELSLFLQLKDVNICWKNSCMLKHNNDIPWYSQICLKHGLISTCQTS